MNGDEKEDLSFGFVRGSGMSIKFNNRNSESVSQWLVDVKTKVETSGRNECLQILMLTVDL